MDSNTEISRVAIVGTGLIGGSWAACFLAHGLDVVATDPALGTEDKVRQCVEPAWSALTKIGLAPGASTTRADVLFCGRNTKRIAMTLPITAESVDPSARNATIASLRLTELVVAGPHAVDRCPLK